MLRFFAGFLSATVLWGALAFLYADGHLSFLGAKQAEAAPIAAQDAAPSEQSDPNAKGKRRRLKRVRSDGKMGLSDRELTTGDDLDWDGERKVDMGAGEAQLSGAQIEAGFDSMMGRIRRCLVLVPSDGEVTGKLIFGMRVGGDGRPRAVNLTGPSVVTAGESGSCLREAAQAIRFASFDGPETLFKYPITLQ